MTSAAPAAVTSLPPKKTTLRLWPVGAAQKYQPKSEFVEGLLREGEFSYIYGPSTAGKPSSPSTSPSTWQPARIGSDGA
jgi:hypothetical protein